MLKRRLVLQLVGLFLASSAYPTQAALTVTVQGDSVVATGVTPGGAVAWLGLSRDDLEFETVYITHRTLLADSDSDASVSFTPAAGIPWKSVFIAVDLASLEYGVAAPEGFEFPLTFLPPGLIASDTPGELDELHLARHSAEVLVARIGAGAFGLGGWDGGDTDSDTLANDTLVFPAAQLAGLAAAPTALTAFETGDLFVVIDLETMEVSLYTLPEAAP